MTEAHDGGEGVAYLRVSTRKQGEDGLGIDAQPPNRLLYARDDRPQIATAIERE